MPPRDAPVVSYVTGSYVTGMEAGDDLGEFAMNRYRNLIGGEWVVPKTGSGFVSINPADHTETLGIFPASGPDDVGAAVGAASETSPRWAATPAAERAVLLLKTAQILDEQAKSLAEELTREEGKTLGESAHEIARTVATFRFFAAEAHRLAGTTLPSDDGGLLFTTREPIGVVAAITPWCFPASIPSRKIAPALAAGATVVLKPASLTPLLAVRLCEALVSAGAPAGVVNLVTGPAKQCGAALVTHAGLNAVSFTGTTAAGESIQRAVGLTCRIQLELGGKNAMVVLADADLDGAVQAVIHGGFGLSGQACTATSRVIIEAAIAPSFTERLVEAVKGLKVGSGLDPNVSVGPLASADRERIVLAYLEAGRKEGARLLVGGEKLSGEAYERGYFVSPALLADVTPSMRVAREEIFGPVVSLLTARDFDEAVAMTNDSEYGLIASIWTRDLARARAFSQRAQVGVVKVNRSTTGVPVHAPFGGAKRSSGDTVREQGRETMEFYTRLKTVEMG